ncbi:hypothetical protein V5799_007076 [Amblyomma americanum]|uniref:Uncharacterized protein n=1 Tax=Amblyomma americanum TaxID=6943 RepID=A0AAQ4DUK2_AMBAM
MNGEAPGINLRASPHFRAAIAGHAWSRRHQLRSAEACIRRGILPDPTPTTEAGEYVPGYQRAGGKISNVRVKCLNQVRETGHPGCPGAFPLMKTTSSPVGIGWCLCPNTSAGNPKPTVRAC